MATPSENDRYLGKYRISSNRLKGWDYSSSGFYFVTLCTHSKLPLFGAIEDGHMVLSPLGEIVRQDWKSIPNHFSGVRLDLFTIMPDHLHGLIHLSEISQERGTTVGRVVGNFHAAVTRKGRTMMIEPVWQHNYYDHIVHDWDDLIRIREYIAKNPRRWSEQEGL